MPLAQQPKILGVTYDPLFSFTPHVKEMAKGSAGRIKVMKALAGTSWAPDTERLLLTFKVLVKSKLDYVALVWSANAKPSSIKRFQAVQNAGLRTVTGSHKLASENHCHS